MSVYTRVEAWELETLLLEYQVGSLVDYRGISEGIENTNYFVTTTGGDFVLTLFESIGYEDLPYYLDLMAFLAEHGVPSAHPLPDRDGHYLRTFKNRPTALVRRLRGRGVPSPSLAQCRAIGEALGHLHVEGRAFAGHRDNARGPRWWQVTARRLLPLLAPSPARLLRQELAFQNRYRDSDPPRGVIHADLFHDNALFEGDTLTGIIDFYYACNDALLFDVAVTVNDWCGRADGSLEAEKAAALLAAYHEWRPLLSSERALWPVMLRAGCLRFWLSRLQDQLFPRPGELTQIKDPEVFERALRQRVDAHRELAKLLP